MTKGVSWQRQAIQKRLERLGWRVNWGKKKGGWANHDWHDGQAKRMVSVGFIRLTQVKEFADWLEAQVLLDIKTVKEKRGPRGGRLGDLLKRMAKEDKKG